VVFDELFTTITNVPNPDQGWIELFLHKRDYYGPDDDKDDNTTHSPPLNPEWLPEDENPIPEILVPEGGVITDIPPNNSNIENHNAMPPLLCREDHDHLSDIDEEDNEIPIYDDNDNRTMTLEEAPDPTREEQRGRGKRTKNPNQWIYGGK
jgi:hypothetical protein